MTADDAPLDDLLDRVQRRNAKLQRLLEVAKALGAERDPNKLLEEILTQATRVIDADRCTLFIVEDNKLRAQIAQGVDTKQEISVPLGSGIAGQCAQTNQIINIADPYADPRFNPSVDKLTGYKTKSLLTVPMQDGDGRCCGVLQALNKKSAPAFTAEDEDLLLALGGSAAVALSNAFLHRDIERLFEGFITASVYAIEARDPTTRGHSERVAELTVFVAEAVNKAPPPEHRGVHFSADELRELRYAALLHDFGKVGVREHVLVKANKLYPHELDLMRERFEHVRARADAAFLQRKVAALEPQGLHGSACDACAAIDAEHVRAIAELDELWAFIEACNRPTVLEQGGFERLQELGERSFTNRGGQPQRLLLDHERANLSITRGSLNAEERLEIESHVTHTFKFLSKIPWTRDLKNIPAIASKHHEKLTGNGYPHKLPAADIPPQTRIMTIADIYDALTAKDRPYKKALPHDKALAILDDEAGRGFIDRSLLTVFIESQAHLRVQGNKRLEGTW